jgi:hypothetical protein
VQRGLEEELGISVALDSIQGPLAPWHLRVLHIPGSFCDREFVESYRCVSAHVRMYNTHNDKAHTASTRAYLQLAVGSQNGSLQGVSERHFR